MRTRASLVFASFAICLLIASAAESATFTVTTNAYSGPGTLTQAILDANANPGPDRIVFAIGSGPQKIVLGGGGIPTILDTVDIDATTQPGFAGQPIIEIDGSSTEVPEWAGFDIEGASGCTIRGFVIHGIDNGSDVVGAESPGILIHNGSNSVIAGNYIGTDPTGMTAIPNGAGIRIDGSSSNNRIGGSAAADHNLISGNRAFGILVVGANGTTIQGNVVGLNRIESAALPNGTSGDPNTGGVQVVGNDEIIGGSATGQGNVIAGNLGMGLHVNYDRPVIRGNHIGTDTSGSRAFPNEMIGLYVTYSADAMVGGTGLGDGNVIEWNNQEGIATQNCTNLTIQGNVISHNVASGIWVFSDGALIGGTTPSASNVIEFNGGSTHISSAGVMVAYGTGISILGNSIGSTSGYDGLGIDLYPSGVLPNDDGDTDTGYNMGQNYPVLDSALYWSGTTVIRGTLSSYPKGTFRIELFSNNACDASGYGEGEKFLGAMSISTDATGQASFEFDTSIPALGQAITATATDADGNTSEFSHCITVVGSPGQLSLRQSGLAVREDAGYVNIVVDRNGGSSGTVSASIRTRSKSATAGSDFVPVDTVVTLGPGATSATVPVQILDDSLIEGAEQFYVDLGNPTGGASLGSPSTATVTILDDDASHVEISVQPSAMSIAEGQTGEATVTIDPVQSSTTTVSLTATNTGIVSVPSSIDIPAGESSGSFTITAIDGGVSLVRATLPPAQGSGSATVRVDVAAGLDLSSISPTSGPTAGGTATVIDGSTFQAGCRAFFGEVAASTTVASATEIDAISPPHTAGPVDVVVRCPGGASGVLSSGFTYEAMPPAIASVDPSTGYVGGGTFVTISGDQFQPGCVALFDGRAAFPVSFGDAGHLYAVTPPHGPGAVTVSVFCGPEHATQPDAFTYTTTRDTAPVLKQVAPTSGPPGAEIEIIGSNLPADGSIAIGSVEATVTSRNPNAWHAIVPDLAPGFWLVELRDASGAVLANGPVFEVESPTSPTITSIEPSEGSPGIEITIQGTGFLPSHRVRIGGSDATIVESSPTEIIARVPDLSAGSATVELSKGSGSVVASSTFNVLEPGATPVVRSVSPTCVTTDGGALITIGGQGFTADSTVEIGGADARDVIFVGDRQLVVTVPAGVPGPTVIRVTNPDGRSCTFTNELQYRTPFDAGDCASRRRGIHR